MKQVASTFIALLIVGISFAQNPYSFKVEKSGEGTVPIILIPGYTCNGDVWETTLAQLDPKFSCHTLTMAGFAGQPAQAEPSLENWVIEIATYIENENLKEVVLIGHSLGGLIAQWLAMDHPKLITQIIVVDALPCLAALNDHQFESNENTDCSPMINMFTDLSDEQFETNQKMGLPMMTTQANKYDLLLKWSKDSDRKTLGAIYCQLMNTDLRDKIAKIECPSLILLEANFKMMDAAISSQYAKLENAQLEYATKGMHFIMYDDTEWYLDQISNFLLAKY